MKLAGRSLLPAACVGHLAWPDSSYCLLIGVGGLLLVRRTVYPASPFLYCIRIEVFGSGHVWSGSTANGGPGLGGSMSRLLVLVSGLLVVSRGALLVKWLPGFALGFRRLPVALCVFMSPSSPVLGDGKWTCSVACGVLLYLGLVVGPVVTGDRPRLTGDLLWPLVSLCVLHRQCLTMRSPRGLWGIANGVWASCVAVVSNRSLCLFLVS